MWNSLRRKAETVKQKRKAALTCLAKGYISKAVSLLNSQWVADTQDPAVMEALRSLRRPFPPAALRRRHAQMVRDSSSSYKIEYVIVIKNFLNPEGHQNPIPSVVQNLMKGWIWPIGGVALGRVCA